MEYYNTQPRKSLPRLVIVLALFLLATAPLFAQAGGFALGWQELLPVHIAAMSLSGASMITGMLIARYRKGKSKNWLRQHKAFQWSSAILGLVGIVTSFTMVEVTFGTHLNAPHSVIALASFLVIILAITAAYAFLKRKKHKKELRVIHRWIGRAGILAWLVTILFGLFAAGIL